MSQRISCKRKKVNGIQKRTLQRLATENDARAHLAASAGEFLKLSREKGLRAALTERDRKFGDGRARVEGPEIRDEQGRLIDP